MQQDEAAMLMRLARRNCLLCSSRRKLRLTEKERENARASLENLYRFLLRQFDELRKTDVSVEEVTEISRRRRVCLDLLDECNACDKEIDHINRGLLNLK